MSKEIYIDFSSIGDMDDFYQQLKSKLSLPSYFGDNLDALYDTLTGYLPMPLHMEFVNLSVDQLETFQDLLETMEDASENIDGLTFTYFLEQFDD